MSPPTATSRLEERPGWFALSVVPRKEKAVAKALRAKGFQDFLPLYVVRRKWSDRVKEVELPLFPGYVFCRFDPLRRLSVLKVAAVLSILGSRHEPEVIPEAEIAALQTVCQSGLHAVPYPWMPVGSKVQIEAGPLSGIEGTFVEAKQARLILSISLLQRSVALEIDRAWVAPVRIYREFSAS
jgi:transcription antitermination factor NusG